MLLDRLQIAKYRFVLHIQDPLRLPAFKGGILRGAFGTAFKRIACRNGGRCQHCQQPDSCAYGYVFETPVPPEAEVLRTHQSVPHPFIIEPAEDERQQYQPGDTLSFDLILIGAGIQHFPYFVLAFKALGAEGLGPDQGRFQLRQIWALDALGPWQTLIYDGSSDTLRNEQMLISLADMPIGSRFYVSSVRCHVADHFSKCRGLKGLHCGRSRLRWLDCRPFPRV